MDRGAIVLAVIGSAAVGALVSSIISEIGRWRERKSRREELALTKAFELAHGTFASSMELLKAGRGVEVMPQTMMIRDAFRMCQHLLDHGILDPQTQKELDEELKKHAESEMRR
jgi:hypothetical protein